jgi:hypothetical protein
MAVFVTDYCTLGQLQFWVTFGEVSERKWLASNECVEKAASGTSSFPPPSLGPSSCNDEVLVAPNIERRVFKGRRKASTPL